MRAPGARLLARAAVYRVAEPEANTGMEGEMNEDGKLPRILVVDDSRMVRATIVKHIRGRFEVREETDGEAGWQTLLVDPDIELVLTDIGMPRLDGYGLLERIRASRVSRVRDLPVVIISGDEDESARERALTLGANGFIAKGTGSVELIATLSSLVRLAKAQSELERNRAAHADQGAAAVVDTETGLASPAYLKQRAVQGVAEARRQGGDISAMVVRVDQFDALEQRYGEQVAQLVLRKLGKMLAGRIRTEDTLSQHSASEFVLLSPGIDRISSCAFALRVRSSVERLVMVYREERIRVTLSIGVANAMSDGREVVSELLALALERAAQARAQGGNRVVGRDGEVDPDEVERMLGRAPSIDHVLRQLRAGEREEIAAQLPQIVGALMPLLELLESRLHAGIPLARLGEFHDKSGSGKDEGGFTRTVV